MKSKLLKNLNATVILYFIIAGFFLILHFFQLQKSSGIVGNISYISRISRESGMAPSKVRRIRIYFNGVDIQLTPVKRLRAITSDGIAHPLNLQSYEVLDDRLSLQFNNDITLNIISDIHSKKVTIQPDLPLTIPPMERLIIPLSWLEGFQLTEGDELLQLSRGDEENFYLTLPAQSTVIQNTSLDINVSNNILRDVVLEETLSGTGRTLDDWFEKEGDRNLYDIFNREVNSYQDLVFRSLQDRLQNNGEINDPQGNSYFSEEAHAALLIQAVMGSQYPNIQAELAQSSSTHRSRLTHYSTPYLGDIVTHGSALVSSDWRLQSQIKTLLEQQDHSIFDYDDLYIFFQTQRSLIGEIPNLETLASEPSEKEEFSRIINKLSVLCNLQQHSQELGRSQIIDQMLQDYLLEQVYWIKEDLLLFDQQGIAQMEASLLLGRLLISHSNLFDEKKLSVGYKMILSVLKYKTSLGYLPETLIFSSNGEPESAGQIAPENVFRIVNQSAYRPRRIDLAEQLGQGSWVYTGTSKFSLSSTLRETVINIDFPVDSAHHLVIRGIKPFNRIFLHGIRWKSDQNFQRYSDGWLYDDQRHILYLKVQHRRPTETIRILYYDPDAEQAAAQPVSQ